MNYGFVKVAAAVPHVKVADCFYNIQQIEGLMRQASQKRSRSSLSPNYRLRLTLAWTCSRKRPYSETPRKPCWI